MRIDPAAKDMDLSPRSLLRFIESSAGFGVYTFDSGKEFMLTGVSLSQVFVNLIDSGSV